jgi:hypothetical protein
MEKDKKFGQFSQQNSQSGGQNFGMNMHFDASFFGTFKSLVYRASDIGSQLKKGVENIAFEFYGTSADVYAEQLKQFFETSFFLEQWLTELLDRS